MDKVSEKIPKYCDIPEIAAIVISKPGKGRDAIMSLLSKGEMPFLSVIPSVGKADAIRQIPQGCSAVFIINAPLISDDHILLASELTKSGNAVLLITSAAEYKEILISSSLSGVFVLPRPLSEAELCHALWMLIASVCHDRLNNVKTDNIELQIDEIKTINRAKWVLIDYLKMNEEQAHRYIAKQAMDLRISRLEAAKNILKTYI